MPVELKEMKSIEFMGHSLKVTKACDPEDVYWENVNDDVYKFYIFLLIVFFILCAIISYGLITFIKMFEFVESSYGIQNCNSFDQILEKQDYSLEALNDFNSP